MRISLERRGGVTGMPMRVTIDTSMLSPEQIVQLNHLITATNFFDLSDRLAAVPHPDRFQYRITIEDAYRTHSVTISETVINDTLRPLLAWLMEWGQSG
jgi:hypothetical protein